MHKPVWLYWENFRNKPEPAYVTLCRWTMLHNWHDANLIFLAPGNIDYYLPGLSKRVAGIESSFAGRADRLKRKFVKKSKSLAIKADVIRASMLRTYGGFYADASTIALKPLDSYFAELNRDGIEFLVSQRDSHGRSDYPVSIYGCNPESKIIQEYVRQMYAQLAETREFDYNGLGTILLTPVVRAHLGETAIIPERDIMPVTYEEADRVYRSRDIEPEQFISGDNVLFKLFNSPFKGELAGHSIEQLYRCNCFIGKLFRHALPEDAFETYRASMENWR